MNGKAVLLIGWASSVAGAMALAQTTGPTTAPSTSATTTPATVSAVVSTTNGFAPITYFEDNCARCHGSNGSAYGPKFGEHLTDEQLTKVVDDMAAGPGNAPVNAQELESLVAYHKAMIEKAPYIAIIKASSVDGWTTVEGEVTPDDTVMFGTIAAKQDGSKWTITVKEGEKYSVGAALTPAATQPTAP